MGWKDWVYGDLVSAADFQSLVQDQTVQRYADSAARTSALGSAVAEGMVSYLDDSNSVEVYTGSGWDVVGGTGRNAILNSAFDIWQRGTSVALAGVDFTADRWLLTASQNTTSSQQLTSDTTNLPDIRYAGRFQRNSGNTATSAIVVTQSLETANSRQFAGKNVTLSFYARKGANFSSTFLSTYIFSGTGTDQRVFSYTGQATVATQAITLTTSWVRYSITGTVASTANELALYFEANPTGTAGAADYFEITGVQLEAGSSATPFKRNAPSIQGELAACQRYYWRQSAQTAYSEFSLFQPASTTTQAWVNLTPPVTMRVAPTSVDYSTLQLSNNSDSPQVITSVALGAQITPSLISVQANVSSGLTTYRNYEIRANNSTSAYLGFSAEL